MASVYKRHGSNIWQASFFVPDPKTGEPRQVRKSTGKRTEREAKAAAAELERTAREEAGLTDDRCRRIHAIIVRAGEDAVRMTLNATKARTYLAQLVKISTGEDTPSFSIKTWTNEWLTRKLPSIAPASAQRYGTSTKAFLGWLGDKADRPLESVTVADMRKFRTQLEEGGRSSITCQYYINDIGSVFRAAIREGLITFNPATVLEKKTDDGGIKRQPFTLGEVEKLLIAASTDEWRGLILIGAYTGLRLGDAARLPWSALDLSAGTITTIPMKTKRKDLVVTIPMHPEVRKYLAKIPKPKSKDLSLFPSLVNSSIKGRNGLSRQFGEIMDLAKVSRGESSKAKEGARSARVIHARSFHSLRHTFTSWLANADVAPELRMKLTGHTTAEVHAGYTHHELATLADAVTKLPNLGNG